MARNYGPGDENATKDMSAFVAKLDDLRAAFPGSTVAVAHHSGHEGADRARGSIALKAACDFEYRVNKSGDTVKAICTKMKDAPERAPATFSLEDIDLGFDPEGKPMGSAVLIPAEGDDSDDAPAKLSRNAKLARETYVPAAAAHGVFDPEEGLQGVHAEDWRTAFYAKHTGDNTDAKKKAFQNGRKALVDKGLMTVTNDVYLTTEPVVRMAIVMQREGRDNRDGTGQN
nr:helicase RepA family protein [Altererythrobacter sp. B11]